MTKADCFKYFGIVAKNPVWSWAGLNESGDNRKDKGEGAVAALTLWTDQVVWSKEKRCNVWSIYNKKNEIWIDSNGNNERIEIIKFCIKNLNSEFRPIFVVPKKLGVFDETRDIERQYIKKEQDMWFKITCFNEATGECEAESFIR